MMEANPYKAPNSTVADLGIGEAGLEVTWARAAKVWWSLIWRAVLFGGLGGMVAGGIAGGILGAAGVGLAMVRLSNRAAPDREVT
jgi:hypothetical protein